MSAHSGHRATTNSPSPEIISPVEKRGSHSVSPHHGQDTSSVRTCSAFDDKAIPHPFGIRLIGDRAGRLWKRLYSRRLRLPIFHGTRTFPKMSDDRNGTASSAAARPASTCPTHSVVIASIPLSRAESWLLASRRHV